MHDSEYRLGRAALRTMELRDAGFSFAQIGRTLAAWWSDCHMFPGDGWCADTAYLLHRAAVLCTTARPQRAMGRIEIEDLGARVRSYRYAVTDVYGADTPRVVSEMRLASGG
jgi:hypothetical protein